MSKSDDRITADGGEQQRTPEQGVRQSTQPVQQGSDFDLRRLAIFCGVGFFFNMGFAMLLLLAMEIAWMLGIVVMMVATSIFTGYLVMQIANSAGVDLMRKIEGR